MRFNLLPYRILADRQRKRLYFIHLACTVMVAALVSGGVTVWLQQLESLQIARNERLQQQMQVLAAQASEVDQIEKKIQELVSRMNTLSSLDKDKSLVTELINTFSKTQPDEITLNMWSMKQKSLEFEGKTKFNDQLSEWLEKLSTASALNGVFLKIVQQDSSATNTQNTPHAITDIPVKNFTILGNIERKGPDLSIQSNAFEVKTVPTP